MIMVATWVSLAFVLGLVVRTFGLPPLVGYLGAGFILSAYGFESDPALDAIAHAGVLLLLFIVGLKLRLRTLIQPEVLIGSVLHMAVVSAVIVALLYSMTTLPMQAALFTAVALSFSSTVIAAKVLEGKKELRAFHGRVAIGILIVQDLVAVGLLSFTGGHAPSPWALSLFGLFFLRPLFYRLLDISGHDELLLLFGLLIAFVFAGAGFEFFGLSSELGAVLFGILLADHKRAVELSDSLWGLKEVFLVGFFLQIGMAGVPDWLTFWHAALLCLLLPVKAMLLFFILLVFKLRARSSFLAALTLATYSEFGLIVANMGVRNGWLATDWLVLLAIAVALSFVIAAPLNRHAHVIYSWLEQWLLPFESGRRHPDDKPILLGNSHLLVMGMGRVGTGAYDLLSERGQRVIGMDSDPAKAEHHRSEGRRVLYGDAEDPGLWENLSFDEVHAVLLAMPDLEANTMAARQLRKRGFDGLICATAVHAEELDKIRKAGADVAYNYYDQVGVGFAERVWELMHRDTSPSAPEHDKDPVLPA